MNHDEDEPNSIMHSKKTDGNTAIFNDVFREFNTTGMLISGFGNIMNSCFIQLFFFEYSANMRKIELN